MVKQVKKYFINITIDSLDRLLLYYGDFTKFNKLYLKNKFNVIDYNLKYIDNDGNLIYVDRLGWL